MAKTFKRQSDAAKWLASVAGCFLEEGTALGKWAAYVPDNSKEGQAIGYGATPVEAIENVSAIMVE